MKRYNKEIELSNDLMAIIGSYMNDEKREDVHAELAPCTPEEFLTRYLELEPEFAELLKIEFDIEV